MDTALWSPVVFDGLRIIAWVVLVAWVAVLAIRAIRLHSEASKQEHYTVDWWVYVKSIKWHLIGMLLILILLQGIGGRESAFRPKTNSNAPSYQMLREARERNSRERPAVLPPSRPSIMESAKERSERNKAEADEAAREFLEGVKP